MNALSDFDLTWQQLPLDPTKEDLLRLLERQLDTPSFAVPVAHPSQPGGKAFAQALLLPATVVESRALHEVLEEVLRTLVEQGRIDRKFGAPSVFPKSNLAHVLVLRSDDPALASPRPKQPGHACSLKAP